MKIIERPHENDYCEKCIYNDGDYDNLCCIVSNFCNCGAVIKCGYFKQKEVKEDAKDCD